MSIGYYSGDPAKLIEDLQALKPTIFPSVPRLFLRVYDSIQSKIKEATGVKATLVQKAIASKLHYLENGSYYTHKIYDTLVFNKMKGIIGGNVRLMITGSAPISQDILKFL